MNGRVPSPPWYSLWLACMVLWSCGESAPDGFEGQPEGGSANGEPTTSFPSDAQLLDEQIVSVPVETATVRTWLLEEEWRIGGPQASRETAFGSRPVILAVDLAMNTYAIDGDSRQVRVFGPNGRWIRTFGRMGQGPGEFQDVRAAGWDSSGRLWVRDRNRYTVFDSLGVVQTTVPRPAAEYPTQRRGQVVFRGDGRMIEDVAHPRNVYRYSNIGGNVVAAVDIYTGNEDLGLHLFDPIELTIDTLPPVRAPDFDRRVGLQEPPPASARSMSVARTTALDLAQLESYVPRLAFAITPEGVWSVASNGRALAFRSFDGGADREVELVRTGSPLNAEEEQLIDASMAVAGRSREDFAYGRQWIRGMHVLEDGHILIFNQEGPAVDPTVDVYDLEGVRAATLVLDVSLDETSTIASRGSKLVVVAKGEFGEKIVVSYRIVRT